MRATMTIQDDNRINNVNNWITLLKNAIWILGLVAVAAIKLNSIDNVNASQDERITRIQKDNEILKSTIDSINNKQVDQLVMLTKLLTIAEQSGNTQSNKKEK